MQEGQQRGPQQGRRVLLHAVSGTGNGSAACAGAEETQLLTFRDPNPFVALAPADRHGNGDLRVAPLELNGEPRFLPGYLVCGIQRAGGL